MKKKKKKEKPIVTCRFRYVVYQNLVYYDIM
jgi:hypothetical protein